MSWQAQDRDALQKFMRESILQLCRINLGLPGSYEVDGIICITRGGSTDVERKAEEDQIVVKVHEQIKANTREDIRAQRSNVSILREYLSSQGIPSRLVKRPSSDAQPPLNLKRKANDENDNAVIDIIGNNDIDNRAKLLRCRVAQPPRDEVERAVWQNSSVGRPGLVEKISSNRATNSETDSGSLELFSCGSCLLDFGSLVSLKGHFKVSHKTCLEQYCRVCAVGFLHAADLEKHNSSVHRAKPVKSVTVSRRKQIKPRRGFSHEEVYGMGNGIEDKVIEDAWKPSQSGLVRENIIITSDVQPLEQTPLTKVLSEDTFSYTGREELDDDRNSKAVGSEHVCPHCPAYFADFTTFAVHCQAVHHRYPCPHCLQTFTQRVNRDRHVHNHTGERPYECARCGDSFTRRDALRKHQLKCNSINSGGAENVCSDQELDRNMPLSDDDSQIDVHENTDCGLDLSLATSDHLRSPREHSNELSNALDHDHIPIVVSKPNAIKSFISPRASDAIAGCSPLSAEKNELPDFDMLDALPPEAADRKVPLPTAAVQPPLITEGRWYSCEICRTPVVGAAAFELHCRNEHRRTPCVYCGKTFSQKGNMERHQRQHTGERPFGCPHCSCSYTRKETLKVHINQAHPDAAAMKAESQPAPTSNTTDGY